MDVNYAIIFADPTPVLAEEKQTRASRVPRGLSATSKREADTRLLATQLAASKYVRRGVLKHAAMRCSGHRPWASAWHAAPPSGATCARKEHVLSCARGVDARRWAVGGQWVRAGARGKRGCARWRPRDAAARRARGVCWAGRSGRRGSVARRRSTEAHSVCTPLPRARALHARPVVREVVTRVGAWTEARRLGGRARRDEGGMRCEGHPAKACRALGRQRAGRGRQLTGRSSVRVQLQLDREPGDAAAREMRRASACSRRSWPASAPNGDQASSCAFHLPGLGLGQRA